MNKTTYLLLLVLTLILTACSGTSNAAGPASDAQTGPSGELSASMQVVIGTIKLDATDNTVSAAQAAELLPLWETLQDLYGSDTAANQEIDALLTQIQDTMTADQIQAITTMNLTRQDMVSIMQSQGLGFGGAQNGNAQSGNSSNNNGGGGFQGPPPDGGGFPGGNPNFQGQGSRTQPTDSTNNSNSQTAVNPSRIPTPLIQAVIEYLKRKAGS